MSETAKIMTLRDHDTGEPIAPRTVVEAISGTGKKWNYVGFTEDNVLGVIDGTWPCNPNLLDNWYLANPVNQKGKTEYTSGPYAIDRWVYFSPNSKNLKITENGTVLPENCGLTQIIENKKLIGETVTCSVFCVGNIFAATTFKLDIYPSQFNNGFAFSPGVSRSGYPQLYINRSPNIADATIIAIKLELGDTQTLAHKEDDTWVLNEIQDYGTELAKCQRYQVVLPGNENTTGYSCVGSGVAESTNKCVVSIPLPVSMRTRPTISMLGNWLLANGTDWASGVHCTEILQNQISGNQLSVYCNTATGLVQQQRYDLVCVPSAPLLVLDANL